MVNTRSQVQPPPDGQAASESTADQPEGRPIVRTSPRINIGTSNPVMEENTLETRLRNSMLQAMGSAMAQQQERLMKMLDDRDNSIRQRETTAENALNEEGNLEKDVNAEAELIVRPGRKERGCSYKTFLGCKPPEFSGTTDPTKCMNWIREIEMSFEASECEDSQRVKFASHLLKGEALTWWNLIRSSIAPAVLAKLTWAAFKKKILDKYCSERALDKIEDEFRGLKKGSMSVVEYSKLFLEKLGLVEHLAPDEKMKIKAYQRGLPASMKTDLRNAKVSTVHEAIEESLKIEDDLIQEKLESGQVSEKRKCEGSSEPVRQQKQFIEDRNRGDHRDAKWCHKCKRHHVGTCSSQQTPSSSECVNCGKVGHLKRDCPMKGPICFECRESGHIKRDCPKLKLSRGGKPRTEPLKATGGAFQMTSEEAKSFD